MFICLFHVFWQIQYLLPARSLFQIHQNRVRRWKLRYLWLFMLFYIWYWRDGFFNLHRFMMFYWNYRFLLLFRLFRLRDMLYLFLNFRLFDNFFLGLFLFYFLLINDSLFSLLFILSKSSLDLIKGQFWKVLLDQFEIFSL